MKKAWVSFTLEVASILHIGSGEHRCDENGAGQVALLVSDNGMDQNEGRNARPYIPGSTLKGALRRLQTDSADILFGTAHGTGSSNSAGRLLVFGASSKDAKIVTLRRTKINAGTGVAETNKLFAKEYVEPGATFNVEICVRPLEGDNLDKLVDELCVLLGYLATQVGIEIASGKSNSFGRMRLKGDVTTRYEQYTFDGGRVLSDWSVKQIEPVEYQTKTLHLHCRGPYLVHDPMRKSGRIEQKTKKEEANHLMPLVLGETPRLLETGVCGALKTCAGWLTELGAAKSQLRSVKTTSGPRDITTLERLFGEEGYQAKLKIMITDISAKGQAEFPSVKLNPLTQGPVPSALFFVHAHYNVGFTLHFSARNGGFNADEQALLDAVLDEVHSNGIQLGFGGSKGFGWFQKKGTVRDVPDVSKLEPPKAEMYDKHVKLRLPDPRITLPYRTIAVDPDKILMPEAAVTKAFGDLSLHSKKLDPGVCGHIDVSWLFDTPMLIGASKGSNGAIGPLSIGSDYILPGSTLRGNIRAYLAAITNSRLQDLPDLVSGKNEVKDIKDVPLQKLINSFRSNKAHNPNHDETFEPDFVEALFGFVHETEEAANKAALHERMHLKSRVSFEPAFLENEPDVPKGATKYTLVLGGPTGTSNIYDAIARKTYPAESMVSSRVTERLSENAVAQGTDSATSLHFLHPKVPGGSPVNLIPLHFRGRIHFHNVTLVELGALLWAITLGGRQHARHRIGHAKAFGTGRARAAGLELIAKDNKDSSREFSGPNIIKGLMQQFEKKMSSEGFTALQAWAEVAATDIPAYGKEIKRGNDSARIDGSPEAASRPTKLIYQTWSTLGHRAGLDKIADEVRRENGGRLAAALKPDPK